MTKLKKTIRELADLYGVLPNIFRGQTLRVLFAEAEHLSPEIWVAWCYWTDAELDAVL